MGNANDDFPVGEELYKELTNGIPGAIFRYILKPDFTDRIAYMSAGCFAIWELEAHATLATPSLIWEQVVKSDVKGLQKSILDSAENMSFWSHEWQIITPSGKRKTIRGSGSPKLLSNNDIVWNSVIIDVGTERHMKNALDSFFGQPFSMNAIVDLDGKFIQVNQQWTDTLGYTKQELEGKYFIGFVHPDDVELTVEEARSTTNNETGSVDFVNRYRHSDGSYRLFSWSSNPSPSEGLIYATAIDITESRRAEDKLRQAATVFESTADGVMIINLERQIVEVNRAFCDITGLSVEESVNQKLNILYADINDESFYAEQWQKVNESGNWHGEVWSKRSNGSIYPQLLTLSTIRKEGATVGYVGVFSDISLLQEHKEKLVHLAHHDPLTDLPNRLLFKKHLSKSIKLAAKNSSKLAIIFIDLDSFKHINDSLGHAAGDQLLSEIAYRLLSSISDSDTVARISGDEFVILLNDIKGQEQVINIAKLLLGIFLDPFHIKDIEISLTASMGISMYPNDAQDISTLMANADAAMYKAKENGKNTFTFYSSEFTSQAVEFVFMENALKKALIEKQFFIQYQPQISSDGKGLIGLEALVRWQHPSEGLISPSRFIPVAEQNGTIRELGNWVLLTACAKAAEWLASGHNIGRLAVNVSAVQFYDDDFLASVIAVLNETRFPARHLELEITEGLVIRNTDEVIEKLYQLQKLGISVAVDDFGTGYSSLSYLKKLPVDRLKIDMSFIKDIPRDADDMAITDAIIGIAQNLHLDVIAEGVETQSQVTFLSGKDCDFQGFFFSKPLDADAVPNFLMSLS